MALEVHIKADGPVEEQIMATVQDVLAALKDVSGIERERVEAKTKEDALKANIALLSELKVVLDAKIVELNGVIADLQNGGAATPEQLQEILEAAEAYKAKVDEIITPDAPVDQPTGPGE